MYKYFILIPEAFILLIISFSTYSQNAKCTNLKNGTFYNYPKNTADRFLIERNNNFQKETNLVNGDTILWKIEWNKDCSYTLKYISGNGKMTEDILKLLNKHKVANVIENVTDEYYVFKSYFDKPSLTPIEIDTIWFHEKINVADNELFKQILSGRELTKAHFKDTSKYAVLYLYRPAKGTGVLGGSYIYFDNNLMCYLKYNSSYIFKILKEGEFNISSIIKIPGQVGKQYPAIEKINVKFGKKYYIKSLAKISLKNWGNWIPELFTMNPENGQIEFDNVQ